MLYEVTYTTERFGKKKTETDIVEGKNRIDMLNKLKAMNYDQAGLKVQDIEIIKIKDTNK